MNAFKKLLSVVCAIVLFLLMFSVANFVLMLPDSRVKYTQFMEDDQSYDVLFFGSSHVTNGISPLDLFHNYGFTSYNLAINGTSIKDAYFQMEEIANNFKKKLPKLIVLDVFRNKDKPLVRAHKMWDSFYPNIQKWNMTKEIFERKDRLEIMLPFAVYHSRWNEAIKSFYSDINKLYGVILINGVRPPGKEIIKNRKDKEPFNQVEMDYLQKIRMFCNRNGIDLILIHIPYSYRPNIQREANSIYEFATNHSLPYVNYMNENIGINFDIDFFDAGHLNPVGMRIMTNEIGKLLQQNTRLHDRRNEPIAKRWNEEYQDYINYRIESVKVLENTNEFLMACNDPDLTVHIEVNNKILTDKTKWLLIERLEKIKGNTIKKSFDKVTHTKADKKTQKCDLSAVVFRRDNKKEVFRAAFSASEKMK